LAEKSELVGTKALIHIQKGERAKLRLRGSNEAIVGYHNKERMIKANRFHWYDIKSDVERRGRASILIPRLIYREYMVLWNKAGYVPGGITIELIPNVLLQSREKDVLLFLSIFNSTLMEVMIRGYAQMHGGGTSTVGLSQIRSLLTPDVTRLTLHQQNTLIKAYQSFLTDGSREGIDTAIWSIFELNSDFFYSAADDLQMLAITAKKKTI